MKKVTALFLTAVMILTLAGCGGGAGTAPASGNNAAEDSEKQEETAAEGTAATESPAGTENTAAAEGEAVAQTTGADEPVQVLVGVFGLSEFNKTLWETIANKVKDEGVELEIREYSEPMYSGISNREFDICIGLSKDVISEAERYSSLQTSVLPVGYTFVTPFNLYSRKYESIDEIGEGDTIVIDLNIDDGGYASKRSTRVLEAAGLITIKEESEMPDYTSFYVKHYIDENLKGVTFETMPHEALLSGEEEFGAILSPMKEDGTLIFEDPALQNEDMWTPLWISADKAEDKAFLDAIEKIVNAFHSQEVLDLYASAGSTAVPVGWDVDLIGRYK